MSMFSALSPVTNTLAEGYWESARTKWVYMADG